MSRNIDRNLVKIFLIGAIIFLIIDSDKTNAQSDTKKNLIYKQWKASMHPGSMDSPEEKKRMNKSGCAHCHSLEGYQEVILDGKESTAPYENPTALTCKTCHKPDKSLRAGKVENACNGCHSMIAENDEENFSWCSQWAIVTGEGPGDFEGTIYKSGAHSEINKRCVGCHMAPSPYEKENELVGGHTFRVMTKAQTPRVLNTNACNSCHDSMNLEFVEQSQQKIKYLLAELKVLLPSQEKELHGEKITVPKYPKDPIINDVQAKAIYNYYMVYKDGSLGVHNPVYTKMILEDSIEKMKFLKKE